MSALIPPQYSQFVHDEVASGAYPNSEAVIADALNLLQAEKRQLSEAILAGIEQLDRGESIPGNEVFRRLRATIQSRMRSTS